MPVSNRERQRRFRERERAMRQRDEHRELVRRLRGESCCCCGESYPGFLALLDGKVFCRNCAHMAELGYTCPHVGVIARIGPG